MPSSDPAFVVASPDRPSIRRDPRPLLWLISLVCAGIVAASIASDIESLRSGLGEMALWTPAFVLVNMLPVTAWKHTPFVPDMPLLLLAALVLRPAETAIVVFVGAFDPREVRGEISLTRAVFNRSQLGLAAFSGSFVAHAIWPILLIPRHVFVGALLALAAVVLTNSFLVCSGVSIDHAFPFTEVLRRMFIGDPWDYVATLSIAAVSASAISIVYEHSHGLALLSALALSLLSRQTLARSQMAVDTGRAYRSREHALEQVSRQIHQERSDERRLIAAELHDEVLQPLFKVTLMAQVLKSDLGGGRLLELDQDLPELLTAAELASTTLRELIGDLRRSALGRGGLAPALKRFLTSTVDRTPSQMHVEVEPVQVPPDTELVLYQIAKEATTNALTHARANHVWVSLRQVGESVALSVRDDGIGFDAARIPEGHYGLEIMRERAAAIGAYFWIDALPQVGTHVQLSIEPYKETK
jgi:signal transduction histidine kinase